MKPEWRRILASADVRAVAGIAIFLVAFFAPGWLSPRSFLSDGQFDAYYAPLANWSNVWIGGWPAGADTAAYVWYPLRILLRGLHLPFDAFVIAAYLVGATGTYAYLRILAASPVAATAAALGFALSGFMIAQLGHTSMIQAAAWLPWMFAGVEGAISRDRRRWAFVLSVAIAMALLAGHMQIAFYGLVVVAAYFAWRLPACWQQGRMRAWSLAALGAVTGALIAAPQLLFTESYLAETPRVALDFATFIGFSLPPRQLPTVLFPYLFGDGSFTGQPFFGRGSYVETCLYIPFLAFALAIPALAYRRDIATFWALVVPVAIVLALGGAVPWLANLTFHLPGFNLFRAPARHVMEACFGMSVLTGLGAQAILDATHRRARVFFVLASALAVAVVLISIPARAYIASHIDAKVAFQPWLHNRAIGVGLVGIAAGLAAVAALAWRFRFWRAAFMSAVVVGLGSFAAFSYWRYQFQPAFKAGVLETSVAKELRETGGRLFYATSSWNAQFSAPRAASLGVPSVNWYGPLMPSRAGELLRMTGSGTIATETLANADVALDLYGAHIVAVGDGDAASRAQMQPPRWQHIGDEAGAAFYRNVRALPLAWLTPAWRDTAPGAALGVMRDPQKFDPLREALVEGLASGGSADARTGDVDAVWDGPATLRIRIDTPSPSFLVASVNGLPGWSAVVDGEARATYRTDHALLGVPVEAGRHEIVLRYRVPTWQWALPWTGALAAIVALVRLPRRRVTGEIR